MKDSLFGKYCYIDTPWIAGKKTVYRILASGVESNSYCDVPVNGKTKPKWHRHFEQIVYVVLDTLVSDRSEILRFALKDVEIIDDESEKRGQGKWEKAPSFLPNYQYIVCSVCGMEALQDENGAVLSNFCPNCGADMRGEQNDKRRSN